MLAPVSRAPIKQVTSEATSVQAPGGLIAATVAGNATERLTSLALLGPWLATVAVNAVVPPTMVQNGNSVAEEVGLSVALPVGTTGISGPNGCVADGPQITCALGTLQSGQSVSVDIHAVAPFRRNLTAFASVTSAASDSNTSNNVGSNTAQVRPRPFTRPGMPLRNP